MSFSKESRYRNITTGASETRRGGRPMPTGLIVIVAAVVLVLCCCCAGLMLGLFWPGKDNQSTFDKLGANMPAIGGPTVTPTVDKNAPVQLNKPGLADNGLEVTVVGVQNPLKVQGTVPLPPDQQFMLVTVRIRNTKTTGNPIRVAPTDFTVKGDGGLTYEANPKVVTIANLLGETNLAPGKTVENELIFQIAKDDSGMRLQWKVGTATRLFLLAK